MLKILLPIDGSLNSLKALRHVTNRFLDDHEMEIHLLYVRKPLSLHATPRYISRRSRAAWYREEAERVLQPARTMLDQLRVPYATHIELGDKVQTITGAARRLHVDKIVMATARNNSFTRMVEDYVTSRVIELAPVPVEVIAGDSISNLERIGLPAGIGATGATLALLYIAVE
jgi:nucleotide-binding universal stress UspA family protein